MPQPATREDISNAENLSDQITELCGYINVATYQLLVMIAEFDRKKYWAMEGFQSCAHWLNAHCGFGLGSARERIRDRACAVPPAENCEALFHRGAELFEGPGRDPCGQ